AAPEPCPRGHGGPRWAAPHRAPRPHPPRRPVTGRERRTDLTRILVVEAEESFSGPLSYSLRKEGYEVAVADDGAEGLRIFTAHGADLVLLDLMLPGMSGTERSEEHTSELQSRFDLVCRLLLEKKKQ